MNVYTHKWRIIAKPRRTLCTPACRHRRNTWAVSPSTPARRVISHKDIYTRQ